MVLKVNYELVNIGIRTMYLKRNYCTTCLEFESIQSIDHYDNIINYYSYKLHFIDLTEEESF